MLGLVAERAPEVMPPAARRLRFALCAGSPASPGSLANWERKCGIPTVACHGLTEAPARSPPGPCRGMRGAPVPAAESAILAGDGAQHLVPNVAGEVIACGPFVMSGYAGDA